MNEFKQSRAYSTFGTPTAVDCVRNDWLNYAICRVYLINESKWANLLRPQAFSVAQWFQFSMKNNNSKLSAWRLPRLPSFVKNAVVCLFAAVLKEFLRQYVTVDETLIHHITPVTKQMDTPYFAIRCPHGCLKHGLSPQWVLLFLVYGNFWINNR